MLINRAPVLTLWATIVAKRMGYSEDEALTLRKAVAGYTALFKGRTLGIYKAKERGETDQGEAVSRPEQVINFMGRQIPAIEEGDKFLATAKDKAIDPDSVQRYLKSKFGQNLEEVASALEELASSYDPEELNNVAFRLYEKFRPEVHKGEKGWGAKGELNMERIRDLKKG